MSQTVACPKCSTDNPLHSKFCIQCGMWIADLTEGHNTMAGTTTINVRANLAEALDEMALTQSSIELAANEVALVISSSAQVIKINYRQPIILGRQSLPTGPDAVFINLNDYQGYALGVSRKHAQIEKLEDQYLLMDLGSSNGTFLNSHRLTPYKQYVISHGDRILIGQLGTRFFTETVALKEVASSEN